MAVMAKQALPLTRGGAKPPRRNNRPLDVEYIQVSGLQSDPRPQRKHSQRQLDNLAGAIARFDIVRPLLVTEDNVVLDGNAVLEVLRREGRDTVPVIRISGYSSAELRSLQMALNRIGDHADWDLDVLRADFLMLQADPEFDFSLDFTGFDQVFVDRVTLAGDVGSQQDEVPEHGEEAPVTRVGDTWCCGRHRIICGDSRDGAIFIMLLDQDRVRLTLTDPPYNVRISGNVSGLGKVRHGEFAMASGEMNRAEFVEFQRQVFDHCKRFSVDGALLYAFIDGRHVADQIAAGETVFGELKQLVVWAKDNAGMGTFYRSQHELLTIWKVGEAPNVNTFGLGSNGRYRSNVWNYPGYASLGAGRDEALSFHPTVKPLPMIVDAILDVTHQGEVVLDPFGGSGTTLIAAERTGRVARLIEIDPKYVDVALRRFIAETGEEPVLAETDEAFSEVRFRRQSETVKSVSESGSDSAWEIL
ncbi:DNA modification methylase [Brevundimonas nasdae]